MSRRLLIATGLALGALWLAAAPAEAQCAMCRTALEGSEEGRGMGAAFNGAILVMLAGPYLLLGSFAAVLFRRRIGAWLAPRAARLRALLRRRASARPA